MMTNSVMVVTQPLGIIEELMIYVYTCAIEDSIFCLKSNLVSRVFLPNSYHLLGCHKICDYELLAVLYRDACSNVPLEAITLWSGSLSFSRSHYKDTFDNVVSRPLRLCISPAFCSITCFPASLFTLNSNSWNPFFYLNITCEISRKHEVLYVQSFRQQMYWKLDSTPFSFVNLRKVSFTYSAVYIKKESSVDLSWASMKARDHDRNATKSPWLKRSALILTSQRQYQTTSIPPKGPQIRHGVLIMDSSKGFGPSIIAPKSPSLRRAI